MEKKKHEELILEAKNFFDASKKELAQSIRQEEGVVMLNFQQISEFSPSLAESITESPEQTIALMETSLEESGLVKKARIRLAEIPKTCHIKIREIRSRNLDQLIWIEGIVRQASDVRPQVVNARFECPNCGAILSVLQIDKKFRDPSRCSCGWKGNFRLLSKDLLLKSLLIL